MFWVNFLHIYQPPNQQQDILERIANESYRPVFQGLLDIPQAKVTLNVNAVLTEMLVERGFSDVVDTLRQLAENNQLEFVSSGKYHPLLPLLPKAEMVRQIRLNDETNREIFGDVYQPRGFFPPEGGYSREVAKVVSELGFEWIVLDEIALDGKSHHFKFDKLVPISGTGLKAFFRNRRLSNAIMGALVRSGPSFLELAGDDAKTSQYLVTAMDGETFGHHRPGLEKVLFDLSRSPELEKVLLSDLADKFGVGEEAETVSCSWASSEKELAEGQPYLLWQDRDNPIQRQQWEFTDFAIEVVAASDAAGGEETEARKILDGALNCSHYWWASPYGWWSLEMIESGAHELLRAVKAVPEVTAEVVERAEDYYRKVVFKAFDWQRTGYVRELSLKRQEWKRIPFVERAKPGEYQAILEILARERDEAASRQEYEQAIKWRDAAFKLKNKTDIYDAIHAVDQLRAEGRLGDFETLTEKYRGEYEKLVPGQPD